MESSIYIALQGIKEIFKIVNEVLSFSNTSVYLTVEGINIAKSAYANDCVIRETTLFNKYPVFEAMT
jgi:hypothetical protein